MQVEVDLPRDDHEAAFGVLVKGLPAPVPLRAADNAEEPHGKKSAAESDRGREASLTKP